MDCSQPVMIIACAFDRYSFKVRGVKIAINPSDVHCSISVANGDDSMFGHSFQPQQILGLFSPLKFNPP